jgi:hypothetical protein
LAVVTMESGVGLRSDNSALFPVTWVLAPESKNHSSWICGHLGMMEIDSSYGVIIITGIIFHIIRPSLLLHLKFHVLYSILQFAYIAVVRPMERAAAVIAVAPWVLDIPEF